MRLAALVSILALGATPVLAQAPKGTTGWLTGCWEMKKGDRLIEEHWMPALGGIMLETGRTTRGDSLVEYEFVVVHLAPGHVAYEAHPSGQPPATFPLKLMTDSTLVFENAAHDFPQRVGYDRLGSDSVVGWIEGRAGGQAKRIEFHYHRVSCE